MILYKLTDDCLKKLGAIFTEAQHRKYQSLTQSHDLWLVEGFAPVNLEEVEQRIKIVQLQCNDQKDVTEEILSDRAKLCEQALNGELFIEHDVICAAKHFRTGLSSCDVKEWIKERKA